MRRLLLLGLIGLGVAAGAAMATPASVHRAARFRLSGLASGPTAFHDTILSGSRRLQSARRAGEWGGSITANDGEVLIITQQNSALKALSLSGLDRIIRVFPDEESLLAAVPRK